MMTHNIPQYVLHGILILPVLVILVTSTPAHPPTPTRHKRHILQMCELIAFHTNRGCLDYNNYGCYCGLGNAASRSVDPVDECCKIHDRCYGQVSCVWMYPQMVGYDVDCDQNGCSCTDSPLFSLCARTTCQCDLEFAQCLGRQTYNSDYSDFDRRECNRPRMGQDRRRRRRRRRRSVSFLDVVKGV